MASPEIFATIDRVAGAPNIADPDVADKVSHDCVLLALQLIEPLPVFETITGCEGGLEAPEVAENVRLPVETDKAGGAAKFSVTLMVAGDPVAPADATVTVSV